ncbi:MAG: hypothetical protein ACC652_03005 [Acidimicrobiales bacterium]
MANYDPRKDRHKPNGEPAQSSLDALLGPAPRPEDTAASAMKPTHSMDTGALDDASPVGRPVATPEPSGLPQRMPRRIIIGAAVGAVLGAVATLWIALKLRALFKR